MISLVQILNEMSKIDLLSKGLQQLHNKYQNDPRLDKLYINFTNEMITRKISLEPDPIIKRFNPDPGHQDPAGLYTYPLQYILDNVDDIPYMADAKYIRVVLDKSKRMLFIDNFKSSKEVKEILIKIIEYLNPYWDEDNDLTEEQYINDYMHLIKNQFPHRIKVGRENWEGRLFLQCIQYDNIKVKVRTPKEQTRLLTKLGYDAIEDSSSNNNIAVINENEPTQTIFLKRNAFDILEIIEQGKAKSGEELPSKYIKIANEVAKEMGLQIKKTGMREATIKIGIEGCYLKRDLYLGEPRITVILEEASFLAALEEKLKSKMNIPLGAYRSNSKIHVRKYLGSKNSLIFKIGRYHDAAAKIRFDLTPVPIETIIDEPDEAYTDKEIKAKLKETLEKIFGTKVDYVLNFVGHDTLSQKGIPFYKPEPITLLSGQITLPEILKKEFINKIAGKVIAIREKQKKTEKGTPGPRASKREKRIQQGLGKLKQSEKKNKELKSKVAQQFKDIGL